MPNGQFRGALPALMIHPISEDRVEIAAFFCKTITTASRLCFEISVEEIPQLYKDWLEDPEKVAFERFKYEFTDESPGRGKSGSNPPKKGLTFSLDDLDI